MGGSPPVLGIGAGNASLTGNFLRTRDAVGIPSHGLAVHLATSVSATDIGRRHSMCSTSGGSVTHGCMHSSNTEMVGAGKSALENAPTGTPIRPSAQWRR